MDFVDKKDGWRLKFAYLALGVAIFAVVWFMAAALGSKFGLWDWQFGFTMMGDLGAYVVGGAAITAGLAFLLSLVAAPRKKPFIISVFAMVVAALLSFRLYSLLVLTGQVGNAPPIPPIHDIQTDWSDEIVLSDELMTARGDSSNKVLYGEEAVFFDAEDETFGGRTIADIQETAEYDPNVDEDRRDKPYGTIEPLIIKAAPTIVFEQAERLIRQRGWKVVTSDLEAGILEATHTSTWFGFKDDVAIRIRPNGDGTRVDMRSISRVGDSDLGANAKRIYQFLQDLGGQRY